MEELVRGHYGIMEPDTNRCAPAGEEFSLCLVPGVGFDLSGHRLGYGKGYYDRFLKGFSGCAAGLAYSCCLCPELPAEDHDRTVPLLVCERGILRTK